MSVVNTHRALPVFSATLISLAGVAVFLALELPLPWLLGAMFPLLFLTHFKQIVLAAPKPLVHPARGILGVAVAAAFTPAIVDSLDHYLVSLLLMLPFLALLVIAGKLYYQRIIGFDRNTSVFCALPGGLLEMTLICDAYGADAKRVVLAHTTRVVLIVFIVPFLIQAFTDYDLSGNLVLPGSEAGFDWQDVLLLFSVAIAGWYVADRLNISGASLVGPMLFCVPLYLSGWVTAPLPGEMINLAQFILGIRIGLSLADATLSEVGRYFSYAAGLFLCIFTLCMVAAYLMYLATDVPLLAVFLAYVPGGQAEMNVIAIILGLHVPYIASHHLARTFLLVVLAPVIIRLFEQFDGRFSKHSERQASTHTLEQ